MGLNFKFIVIWKALSTMHRKVAISAAGVMPVGFGSAGSRAAHVAAPAAAYTAPHVAGSSAPHVAPHVAAPSAAPRAVCGKGGKGGGAQVTQVAQLSSQVIDLKKELASMKAASAATDARLGKVETDVCETKTGIAAVIAMMKEDRTQRALPPPARPAIMPPPSTQRSQSPSPRITLVTSGPEGSFGQECGHWVPKWGSPMSTSTSSGSYMDQNGWADKVVAGRGQWWFHHHQAPSPPQALFPGRDPFPRQALCRNLAETAPVCLNLVWCAATTKVHSFNRSKKKGGIQCSHWFKARIHRITSLLLQSMLSRFLMKAKHTLLLSHVLIVQGAFRLLTKNRKVLCMQHLTRKIWRSSSSASAWLTTAASLLTKASNIADSNILMRISCRMINTARNSLLL